MIVLLLAAAQTLPVGPKVEDEERYKYCIELSSRDPASAKSTARHWHDDEDGGFHAEHCLAMAYAHGGEWAQAADAFRTAATDAAIDGEREAVGDFEAQAGNAWLLAGEAAKAKTALSAALDQGTLSGGALGDVYLDRARAEVTLSDTASARNDINAAIKADPNNGVAWLLSATLARRTGDLRRAKQDIAIADQKSPNDPAVKLEVGNIAAKAGDEAAARAAWQRVVALAPGSARAKSAQAALAQFDSPTP